MKFEELIKHYEKYEHYISPGGLIIGFVWHLLNLRRIDLFFDNLLVIFYLCVTGLAIIYFNAYGTGRLRGRFFEILSIFVPFVMQFSIGGLFCSFLVFYGESSSISVSWPFLAILVFLVIGNEFLRKKYQILAFQISIFFAVIFAYLVFAIPILINRIGDNIFIISGIVSLAVVGLFIFIIRFFALATLKQGWKWLLGGIIGIYLAFNVLYFTNIIPPIPLALKQGGIAHAVSRVGFDYSAQIEPRPWYLFYQDYNPTFHWQPGEAIYCYTSVFAPTNIKTNIYHRWMYHDEKTGQWIEKSKIKYPISGGRDGGYRGYSYKTAIQLGKWRVDVVNERGQVLGRMSFTVVQADVKPELKMVEY